MPFNPPPEGAKMGDSAQVSRALCDIFNYIMLCSILTSVNCAGRQRQEKGQEKTRRFDGIPGVVDWQLYVRMNVCVCACVCVRERVCVFVCVCVCV